MQSSDNHDERLMTIVSAALRLKPEERAAYIRLASESDPQLYHDVEEALDWEQKMGGFLQQPVFVLDETSPPFEAGQIVAGRFEIVREIGAGAMGVVYEAFDRKRNQRIAIKAAKPGFRPQLSPELESALRVRHPNICLVNEIHTTQTERGEVDFLTMELLEGKTLAARLADEGKLSAREAAEIGRQLCAGVGEAHRSGVIHRDLKSANVILCQSSNGSMRAVITDFGLSGQTEDASDLWGTPRYMAPELWLGAKASAASDIYALGVILFEMVHGSAPPGTASSAKQAPAPSVPRQYSRLFEECLNLEPDRRCQAFNKALRHDYWNPSPWTRRKILSAGVAAAFGIAGGAWLEREKIGDLFHPLPRKRFVALLAWPPSMDQLAKPLVSGVTDAIENALARAEASDRDLLVISSHDVSAGGTGRDQISRICESLGANLALEASGKASAAQFTLLLKVLDAKTNAVLRQGELLCGMAEIASLSEKAVHMAAGLLGVRQQTLVDGQFTSSTNSAKAFQAFQAAEELRTRPNDDGLDAAIDSYKVALDADSHYAVAYAKLALAYVRLYALRRDPGALELAEANAGKSLQLDRNLADGHLALAYVFERRGNQEQALDEIRQALALDPGNPRTLLWQAQIYAHFNRWAEAEQAYLRLRRERPNYWMAYNDLGYVFDVQGKYQDAIGAFRAATVAAPASALAFSNLGEVFFKLGNFREARSNFEKSLRLKPNGLAYSNLAEALRAEGNYEAALTFSEKAVELEPSDDRNWLDLADCYECLRGRQTQAREAYRRAATEVEERLRTDPTDGSAWIWLALYRVKSRSREDALPLIAKAERLGVSDVDSELARARVLELLGKRQEAIATLADCFAKGATVFEVSSIGDFAALRKDPRYEQLQKVRFHGGPN